MVFALVRVVVPRLLILSSCCVYVGLLGCSKSEPVTSSALPTPATSSTAVDAPEKPRPVESDSIPAGTKIEVETMEAVDSETNVSGSFVPILVFSDVRGKDGKIGIPKNSSGIVVARSSTHEGTISMMDLVLYQMSVGDHSYLITAPKSAAPGLILKEDGAKGDGHRTVHLAKRTLLTFTLNENLSLKR